MRRRRFSWQHDETAAAGRPDDEPGQASHESDQSRKNSAVQQGFSPVFWRFYDRRQSLEGLIAYGLYKRHKWEYVSQQGLQREDKHLNGYDIGDSMVELFKERARTLISEHKETRSLAETVRKKSGFLASIPHNFGMSMAIPLIWGALLLSGSMVFPEARSDLGAMAIKASIWLTDDARTTAVAIGHALSDQDEFSHHLSVVVEALINECDPSKVQLIASLEAEVQNRALVAKESIDGNAFRIEPATPEQFIECAR